MSIGVIDSDDKSERRPGASTGGVVLNDDGHVFLWLSDHLDRTDLRVYLGSYCRPGVSTVAYCVGDMSWPTLYPTHVGTHYTARPPGDDQRRARMQSNLTTFESEPGGYFGATFAILHEMGKQVWASFRMNDAHYTSLDDPWVGDFWKEHADLALGPTYGYYGGCLDYASSVVRSHLFDRVMEFADLYPEIDGIELDAMRSPFFFAPGKGIQNAPLFTDLLARLREALADRAKRLERREYVLSINVPATPELALACGLDVAAWDAGLLVDFVSVGPYQSYMMHPMDRWKELLVHGTRALAYIGCSPQTGQYLGLEEYRAAAANAHANGADGIYLFNYPCLFELAMQNPTAAEQVPMRLPDMRALGQPDMSRVDLALDEIGSAEVLRGKDKRFLFYFRSEAYYGHYASVLEGLDRRGGLRSLTAPFQCYEDIAHSIITTMRFKVENVSRNERFAVVLNSHRIKPDRLQVGYAANGRDLRVHTLTLGPYLAYEFQVMPGELRTGANILEVTATMLDPNIATVIHLVEVELDVRYGEA